MSIDVLKMSTKEFFARVIDDANMSVKADNDTMPEVSDDDYCDICMYVLTALMRATYAGTGIDGFNHPDKMYTTILQMVSAVLYALSYGFAVEGRGHVALLACLRSIEGYFKASDRITSDDVRHSYSQQDLLRIMFDDDVSCEELEILRNTILSSPKAFE